MVPFLRPYPLFLGQKNAKTKARLLSDSMDIAAFDEKFQISTQLEVDADGKCIGSKMSKLTIVGDKGATILGEAALDMAQFTEDEPLLKRLKLENCEDPDSFLEIALKGVFQAAGGPGTPSNRSNRSNNTEEQRDRLVRYQ